MRKATIIIIAAIYVASIVIVGVFGLQALIYVETVSITDIILPTTIEGKEVKPNADGTGYTVVIAYKEDLIIPIEFVPDPVDAPATIEVTITYQTGTEESPTAELTHDIGYFLAFRKAGKVTLTFHSTDRRKCTKTLSITAV